MGGIDALLGQGFVGAGATNVSVHQTYRSQTAPGSLDGIRRHHLSSPPQVHSAFASRTFESARMRASPPAQPSRVAVRFMPCEAGTEVIVVHESIDTEETRADPCSCETRS
jgi:hypothetical protein